MDEIRNERSDEIKYIVEKISDFNNQSQTGQGFKILTLYQVLRALPITTAQLQAENNPQELKNER